MLMFLILKADLHLTDCFYSLSYNSATERRKKKKNQQDSVFPIMLQEALIQGCFLNAKDQPHKL